MNEIGRGRNAFQCAHKKRILAVFAVSGALILAGCGGGTDSDSASSSDSSSTAVTTGTTANTATTGPGSSVKTTPDTTTTTTSGAPPTVVKTPTTSNTTTTGNGTVSTTTITQTPPADASNSQAAAIFTQNCGRCHKIGSLGQGRMALDHIGGEKNQAWIEVQIRNPKAHKSRMPAFGPDKLSDPDLHTLAQYLASLK